jgi:hypothetical protein
VIDAYFHPVNQNLPPPNLDQTVWRLMRFERFAQLVERRALWFARFDEMEDKEECRVPAKNLKPSVEALISAGVPVHLAHAANMSKLAGEAFFKRIEKEKRSNLINCWYIGHEPSDEMWAAYGSLPGSVAIRSRGIDVGESLSRPDGQECFANPVRYIEHDQDELPMEHFLGPFFAKRRQYVFEVELRYLLHLGSVAPKGAYVPTDIGRLINEVRVNVNDGFDVEAVKELISDVGLAIEVIEAHPVT